MKRTARKSKAKIRTKCPVLRRLSRISNRALAENILGVYSCSTAEERAEGLRWYESANGIASDIASRTGVEFSHAVGIVAALSPSVHWDRNVADAYRLAAGNESANFSTYGPNVTKARKIRDGADPLDVLGGNKVRAFFACILDPSTAHGTVCVDRHAVAVAFGVSLGDYGPKYLDLAGGYQRIARAYVVAASRLGILPHALQATTWLTWRNLAAAGQVDSVVPF